MRNVGAALRQTIPAAGSQKDILKKACPPAKGNPVAFKTIKQLSSLFPVLKLCNLMKTSCSTYYTWLKRPAKLITAEQLSLYR